MEASALHSQLAVFTQQDKSVYFALGIAYAASQLRRSVEAQVDLLNSPAIPAASDLLSGSPPTSQSAGLQYFLLGLLSFSHHYLDILDGLHAGAPNPATATPLPAAETLRLAIRQLLR